MRHILRRSARRHRAPKAGQPDGPPRTPARRTAHSIRAAVLSGSPGTMLPKPSTTGGGPVWRDATNSACGSVSGRCGQKYPTISRPGRQSRGRGNTVGLTRTGRPGCGVLGLHGPSEAPRGQAEFAADLRDSDSAELIPACSARQATVRAEGGQAKRRRETPRSGVQGRRTHDAGYADALGHVGTTHERWAGKQDHVAARPAGLDHPLTQFGHRLAEQLHRSGTAPQPATTPLPALVGLRTLSRARVPRQRANSSPAARIASANGAAAATAT